MSGPVYLVPVAEEKCPTCGGPVRAIYYRIKGLVPFTFCRYHGMARLLKREEHRKFMAKKMKNPDGARRSRAVTGS